MQLKTKAEVQIFMELMVRTDPSKSTRDNPFIPGLKAWSLLTNTLLGVIADCSEEKRGRFFWAQLNTGIVIYDDNLSKTVVLLPSHPNPFLPGARIFKHYEYHSSVHMGKLLGRPAESGMFWVAQNECGMFTSLELAKGQITHGKRKHNNRPIHNRATSTAA